MTRRIFRSVLLTASLSSLLAAVLIVLTLFGIYEVDMTDELRAEAGYIRHALQGVADEAAYFEGFSSQNRVTLISPQGDVLYDSGADPSTLDNHGRRPEVLSALQTGWGESERFSDTLAETTSYYALRTAHGNVLRLAGSRSSIWGVILRALPLLGVVLVLVALFSLVIARLEARSIVAPLNALNLKEPLKNEVYEEIKPMLQRIDHQMRAKDEARQALTAIMENMREGMVLLDFQGIVLAMNRSAARVLGVSAREHIGKNMLSASYNSAVDDAVYAALMGRSVNLPLEYQGRHYQLLAHPVERGDRTEGAVLLVLDITEHFAAEISRREFTANVSHELKTPLTSISGYAEIIRDGIVRPEDVANFAGRIHTEASHLLSLINDILALSRLDERKGVGELEALSLPEIAAEAARRLEGQANEKQIALSVRGSCPSIMGYKLLLDEVFFNLIDNAVKYTPPGGRVDVEIEGAAGSALVRVRDTGIGIPPAHQEHIFERFYRVDKSHSRRTGGTGLGLSIVKHAAEIHRAELTLHSEEGKGTCITVKFPLA